MSSTRINTYNRDDTRRGEQLVQAVATTTPTSILSPDDNEEIEIIEIVIANTSNQNRWISVYHDADGTTYDDTTAVIHEETINSDSAPEEFPRESIFMCGQGNLAVEAQANTALTVTVYGYRRRLD
jgi:hypothetical protein